MAQPTVGVDPDVVGSVFKAYDVRGLVPEQIDEPLARATGRAHLYVGLSVAQLAVQSGVTLWLVVGRGWDLAGLTSDTQLAA